MCGIAGIFSTEPFNLREQARSLLQVLQHRGPDDQGWLLYREDGVRRGHDLPDSRDALGLLIHRRLSILDLTAGGWQPMASPDHRYFIVFNGEIYNYVELRDELETLGHAFHSHSDTEVLLRAFCEWGKDCLTKMIGMFAFAVLDIEYRTLFLARDFFGIKPLYYVQLNGQFAFASEMKALLGLPGCKRDADANRLFQYLRFGLNSNGSDTLFQQIKQLPAAHYMEVDLDDLHCSRPKCYWRVNHQETIDISIEEAVRRLRELFLDNVRLHLRSDVPVGAALSGGIDSSAIVAAMRYLQPNLNLHAFSYIADDETISEEHWVDTAGKTAGASIHKTHPQPEEVADDLDRLIYVQDEPFGSTSIYAQHRVFRLARETGIKVMLDGQGADELLGGYRMFLAARLASLLRQGLLTQAMSFLHRAARQPGSGGLRRVALQTGGLLAPALKQWAMGLAGKEVMPKWLNADWFAAQGVVAATSRQPCVVQVLRQQLFGSLMESSLPMLLRYEDRNSMAHSIESRVPFLTPRFVEFVLKLPEEYLIDNQGTSKNIFRMAMRGIVPDAILDRKDKIGFETPEQRWLTQLRPWVERTINSDRAHDIPALCPKHLMHEWRQVAAGKKRFDYRVWRWVNLIKWAEVFDVRFAA